MSEQSPNQGRDDKIKPKSTEPAAEKLETSQAATDPDTPIPDDLVSAFKGQSLNPIKEEDPEDIFEPEPLNEHSILLNKQRKLARPPTLAPGGKVKVPTLQREKQASSVEPVGSVEQVSSAISVAAPSTEVTRSAQSSARKQAAIDDKTTLEILSSSGVVASDVDSAINSARDLSWPLATILINLRGKDKEADRDKITALRERFIVNKRRQPFFMRTQTQLDNPNDDFVYPPIGSPPRLSKPPPPTPPELESRHHSLSLPTLPVFHDVSDADLIEQYRAEREINRQAFDQRTHRIKMQHIAAKIGRGGIPRLVEGDYTVDLASREDAARAGKWGAPRHSLESDEEDEVRVEENEQDDQAMVNETPTEVTDTRPSKKSYAKAGPAPKSDLDENIVKYMVSGNLKTQKNFTSEKTEGGTKVTRTVFMKATETVVVPEGQSTEWDEVLEALKTGKREHNFFPAAGEEDPINGDPEWEDKALEAEELLEHFKDLTENEILGATMSRLHAQIRAARVAKRNTFPVG